MKATFFSKIVCLALASASAFVACSADKTSALNSESGNVLQAFNENEIQCVRNLCEVVCPPKVCRPVCPPNPCDAICPPRPLCPPNPCRPICPPNPCEVICPPRPLCPPNPCDNPCNVNSCTDMELARFFSFLWRKIRAVQKKGSKKEIKALKRKMIGLIAYAYSLLNCQECAPRTPDFYAGEYSNMTLKNLFVTLKWVVCNLNEKNKCCFLQNAEGIFCF
ncbi:hypothetical protein NEMIN01_0238 [Nematocida minor]|uniref:uncharacterized protein n=1 Tax=Nematocida minor TaxID=1912983 RepID=UPI002220EF85|nr:uncharacterized protein NEMIN01_0238 [Nematocida minor]KAI5188974.1 hypothetical protein NEMIN01_0238 [Nematocida minor]